MSGTHLSNIFCLAFSFQNDKLLSSGMVLVVLCIIESFGVLLDQNGFAVCCCCKRVTILIPTHKNIWIKLTVF